MGGSSSPLPVAALSTGHDGRHARLWRELRCRLSYDEPVSYSV